MSEQTKYTVPDDHWEDDEDEQEDEEPQVVVNTHSIVIDNRVDERYVERYRWRFAVQNRQVVGWTRTDIEHNGTEDYNDVMDVTEIPADVKAALEHELGLDDLHDHLDLPKIYDGVDEDE